MFLRFLSQFVLLLSILTISIPTATPGRQTNTTIQVHGADFEGVIFPAAMRAFSSRFPKGVRYWTPSESEVLAAEKELIPFLSRSNDARVKEILEKIRTYKRQYVGVLINGHK